MAYTLGSAAQLVQYIDNTAPGKVWFLAGTDTDATVLAAGYISDAQAIGMKVGDTVFYTLTTTPELYIHVVTAVTASGATLGSSPATSH